MPVSIRLVPRQEVFAPGSEVVVDLNIKNGSAEPVRIPDPTMPASRQPVFRLRDPEGRSTTFAPGDHPRVSPTAVASEVQLAPGGAVQADLSVSQYARTDLEGEYELEAWLEYGNVRVTAEPARFRVEALRMLDVTGFAARSPEGEPATGLVALSARHRLATVPVKEQDPRNGELFPLEPNQGAEAPGAERCLGWYSNYEIALDPVRWMLAASGNRLAAATNLSPKVASITMDKPVLWWLTGLVVKGRALQLPAFLAVEGGAELALVTGSEPGHNPVLSGPTIVDRVAGRPAAAAATIAPSDGRLLVAAILVQRDHSRLVCWFVSGGKVGSRQEYDLQAIREPFASAVGWSSRDALQVSVLGRDDRGMACMVDVRLRPDLSLVAPQTTKSFDLQDVTEARLACFEQAVGVLARVAVLRSTTRTVGIDAQDRLWPVALPAKGPFALLPGRTRWYAIWPADGELRSASF